VSFLLAALLSFFMFFAFDAMGSFELFGSLDDMIISLGMSDHYQGMSKGLIDTRDVVYFGVLSALFLLLTRLILQSRKW
jgi:ABC-2 type transport system permease protein